MKSLSKCVLGSALVVWSLFLGCSKKEPEAPPPAVEQTAAPVSAPAAESSAPIQNVQQVKANWDAVSQQIANQNYDDAIRAWVAMDQAQRQAQLTEAVRQEYDRRLFQAQEALRQKAETDAKAREAYQAMTRAILRR